MASLEYEITVSEQTVNIGGPGPGISVNAETYNGSVPGPIIEAEVNDTVTVRLINNLPYPTGIHWHGIEFQNSADGTPVTQDGVPGTDIVNQTLGNGVAAGGTYLYRFKVPRPGIFWYHAHHHHSTNRTFKGLYGMIVVTDPAVETPLIMGGTIPGPVSTYRMVLSDVTVCKPVGSNDTSTYDDPTTILPVTDRAEWVSGATAQGGSTPEQLCELNPLNDDGSTTGATAFGDGDIPFIDKPSGEVVEGQTVLVNGKLPGDRLGTPSAPTALVAPTVSQTVQEGEGVRLQIVNCAVTRYFRLRLTTASGTIVPLIRIGGEGGLLEQAVLEGDDGTPGVFVHKYDEGEILLPPATRADVVAIIPAGTAGTTLTMWTRDYSRKGSGFANIPSVPVAHFEVVGTAGTTFPLSAGDALTGVSISAITGPFDSFLDPSGFATVKPGRDDMNIAMTGGGSPSIDNVQGSFSGPGAYTSKPHISTSRYARVGDVLELTVENSTNTHHPFHWHGFSFQPVSLAPNSGVGPVYTWPYQEFRDTVDIPGQHTLTFRVRIHDRELADGTTLCGAFGRWLFHCHIFFHAHRGMLSEFVVTHPDGSEKPYIDVGGSWAYAATGDTATRKGTYFHPEGDPTVILTANIGTVTDLGGGEWEWEATVADQTSYVFITYEDSKGCKDQAVFRLKVGGADDGSDVGDPHIYTVDGNRYDFQAVGEFVLLRDHEGMEVQARQTPVLTANPITDPATGIRSCVSLNTAVAARVGKHYISYQPDGENGALQLYIDGKPTRVPERGIQLDGHRLSSFEASGRTGLRVDYKHSPVLTVTPHFWNSHSMWYLDVHISRTQATAGLMGTIPAGSWLPRLSSGAEVGPMPADVNERFKVLYGAFAASWRLTDRTSLFTYRQDESTATFTDTDWPAGEPPCDLKPQFEIPGAPMLTGMDIADAKQICQIVTDQDLHQACVFDVATTGQEEFAENYRITQQVMDRSVGMQVIVSQNTTATAVVGALRKNAPRPKGKVQFYANVQKVGDALPLDNSGRAKWLISGLQPGSYQLHAEFIPDNSEINRAAASAFVTVDVEKYVEPVKDQLPEGCLTLLQSRWFWLAIIVTALVVAGICKLM